MAIIFKKSCTLRAQQMTKTRGLARVFPKIPKFQKTRGSPRVHPGFFPIFEKGSTTHGYTHQIRETLWTKIRDIAETYPTPSLH